MVVQKAALVSQKNCMLRKTVHLQHLSNLQHKRVPIHKNFYWPQANLSKASLKDCTLTKYFVPSISQKGFNLNCIWSGTRCWQPICVCYYCLRVGYRFLSVCVCLMCVLSVAEASHLKLWLISNNCQCIVFLWSAKLVNKASV